jgi:hypothetical protein
MRKIRKSLIKSGAGRKYVLYAIGEITLVVVGILIALQINNWNQKRIDRLRAVDYHQRLTEDLDFIITRNKNTNKQALKVMNSITETIEILDKGRIESEEEQKVIDYTMVMFTRLSRQISGLSTWDEMKSNGDMNLIYNIELRKNIDALQDFINLAHEVFSKHALAIRTDQSSYFKYARTFVDSITLEETVLSNFDAMAADQEFINQFSIVTSSWRSQAAFGKNINDRASKLKKQIQEELESMSQ